MKMKSIFLSMLAIAALASCTTENFNVDPPGPGTGPQEGEKMEVNISIKGAEKTKAANAAKKDTKINDITVFFLDGAGKIITKHFLSTVTDPKISVDGGGIATATIDTRSTVTKMMVIANVGEDRTKSTFDVSTQTQLLGVTENLLGTESPNAGTTPIQVTEYVIMSGTGDVTNMTPSIEGGPSTASASVDLTFIPAKITISNIQLGKDVQGVYGTNFTFTRAFLLNVQTKSHYFPAGNVGGGSYIPDAKLFINGYTWNTKWGDDPNHTVVNEFNQDLTIKDMTGPATDQAHWYVFENNPTSAATSENPTILVLEVNWMKASAAETAGEAVYEPKWFNVIFAPGDKGVIKAGQAYNVTFTINSDFRTEAQGGNGGGTDKPGDINVSANVSVTVTPTDWANNAQEKPFN